MAKKAVVVDFNIKLAGDKKSKVGKASKLSITSPVINVDNPNFNDSKKASKSNLKEVEIPIVDKCIEMSQAIESLKTELRIYEKDVIEEANEQKEAEKTKGNFVKTVNVQGTTNNLQIQFKDSYSKMDESMRAPLKSIFQEKYPVMFEELTDRTVVNDKEKIKELKQLLGTRYSEFIITDEAVKPTKEFSYNHFVLSDSLKKDQQETVQKILNVCANKPSVKYPK